MVNREDFWELYILWSGWMLYEQKSIHTIVFLPRLALFSLLCLNICSGGLSNLLEESLSKREKLQGNSNHSLQIYQQKSILLRETHDFIYPWLWNWGNFWLANFGNKMLDWWTMSWSNKTLVYTTEMQSTKLYK